MFAARTRLFGIVVFGLMQAAAVADPIELNIWGDVDGPPISQQVTLSDPSQPISIGPFTQRYSPSMLPNGQSSASINSYFFIQITDITPGSPAWGDQVIVSGNLQGGYEIEPPDTNTGRMGGFVEGSGTSASLFLEGSTAADVPPYLADLLNHPERVSYGGEIIGGVSNMMTTTLSIAPPVDPNAVVPAPEPSMLAVAVMAVASCAIVRRLRSRSS